MADGRPPSPARETPLRDAVEELYLRAQNAKNKVHALVATGLIHEEALADTLETLAMCSRALEAVTDRTVERGQIQRDAADFGGSA